MANLVILEPAQRELEEIAQLHLNFVGSNSARNITNLILDTLSRLELFPLSGHISQDKELRNGQTGFQYRSVRFLPRFCKKLVLNAALTLIRRKTVLLGQLFALFCNESFEQYVIALGVQRTITHVSPHYPAPWFP